MGIDVTLSWAGMTDEDGQAHQVVEELAAPRQGATSPG